MMDMAQYYHIHPCEISKLSTNKLSVMFSAMLANKASERIRRIEEIGAPYMEQKIREKFINSIFKQIDDKYKDPHMVSEEEIKRIFNGG